MRFYDRKRELETLRTTMDKARETAQLTVVTGRRRIGKTTLLLKAFEETKMLYMFVSRKAESDLCRDYAREIEEKLGIPLIGHIDHFADIFELLMKVSMERSFTVVIDEFQEWLYVNPSVFGEMQRLWDQYHDRSKINLVVSGSIYRLMTRIFRDRFEPLYGRQSQFIYVKPFTPSVLKEILQDYNPAYSNDDLLALYSYTGGVAKYVQTLMEGDAVTRNLMTEAMVRQDSLFLEEGKYLLVDEFGKDYSIYFSILAAIASGRTARNEIEGLLNREIGGYLTNLEKDYELISKNIPIHQKAQNKNVRYQLKDNFLTFWFRFIYKHNYILEVQAYKQLQAIVERDYEVFSGKMLERYFKEKIIETQDYTRIGGWWDRKGENEIDIIAENEIDKTVAFFEVKRNANKYSPTELSKKIAVMMQATHQYQGYKTTQGCFSLDDM